MTKPRIVIVDDAADVLDRSEASLAWLLERHGFEVVDAVATVEAYEPLLRLRPHDLLLLDLYLGSEPCLGLVRQLAELDRPRVVVHSAHATDAHVAACIALGAWSFLSKEDTRAERIATLHEVHAAPARRSGSTVILSRHLASRAARFEQLGLTNRQLHVLDLFAEGWSRAEIAEKLGVNAQTIKSHLAAAQLKLEAASNDELRRAGRNHGFGTRVFPATRLLRRRPLRVERSPLRLRFVPPGGGRTEAAPPPL